MKNTIRITVFCLILAWAPVTMVLAGSSDHSGHAAADSHEGHGHPVAEMTADAQGDAHGGHDMGSGKKGHDTGHGLEIRTTMVDGYHLAYRLIDMRARMADMENMPEMAATHHLMLFITSDDGKIVDTAMVGFLVENPDGTVQKAMAMGMSGGYGADMVLDQEGSYTIKAKALAGDDKLMDAFALQADAL